MTNFNPRSPCGERPLRGYIIISLGKFQSTLSLRRATVVAVNLRFTGMISIHALLAESDEREAEGEHYLGDFNPRSPCGERHCYLVQILPCSRFQSTLSLRRATWCCSCRSWRCTYFNPRSPCGERRQIRYFIAPPAGISIHALLAESDTGDLHTVSDKYISIHALLAESDIIG